MLRKYPTCFVAATSLIAILSLRAGAAEQGGEDFKAKLLADPKGALVALTPAGRMEKPCYSLVFTAEPREHDRRLETQLDAAVGEDGMKKIINCLADEGSLALARTPLPRLRDRETKRYVLTISLGQDSREVEWGWGKDLQARLIRLDKALDAKASAELRKLAERVDLKIDDPQATRIGKEVVVNGLSFRAIVQEKWVLPAKDATNPATLALEIKNTTDADVSISLFDTVRFVIRDAAGKEVPMDGGRNATRPVPPVLIAKGQSLTADRTGTLRWRQGGVQFHLMDPTGMIWFMQDLKPGKYTAEFIFDSAGGGGLGNPVGLWQGKATTPADDFEIVDQQ